MDRRMDHRVDRRDTASPIAAPVAAPPEPARRDAERARVELVARRLGASVGALEQYLRLKRAEVEPVAEREA